jgi:hypothetical protein
VNGCEYPWLAQVAMQGRIVALPLAMNAWRSHDSNTCKLEGRRKLVFRSTVNTCYLLFRVTVVVLASNLPLIPKTHIMLVLFVVELPKMARKLLRILVHGTLRRAGRLTGNT